MTTPPVKPPGESTGPQGPQQGSTPPPPMAGQASSDPWYAYAQKMWPSAQITPEIIAGMKKNMMTMINTWISEIKARHAKAQEYNAKVARGEE